MSSAPSDSVVGRSLAFRLSLWYGGVLIFGLTALGALAFSIVHRALENEHRIVIESRLERHRAVLEQDGLPGFAHAVDEAAALEHEDEPVRVRDKDGHTVFHRGEFDRTVTTVETSTLTTGLQLEVGADRAPWERLGTHFAWALILVLTGALALGLGGGILVTRRALQPVGALAATARGVIESGDLSRRVTTRKGGSELDELARLFNRMLERNQALVVGMREALDNVAHDLRTPLTRLRGIAEIALGSEDDRQAREALADCMEESDEVLVMLRTLMDISEAETGIMKLQTTPLDVRTLAAATAELYEQVAEERVVQLTTTTGPAEMATVDGTRVRQALANLVDNALKYTPHGGRVVIDVGGSPADVRLTVSDTGPGIPPEALPRIWDRLYRADPSRSQKGLGLGLSLVRAIVRAHGGRAEVQSLPGAGARFTLVLPRRAVQPGNEASPATPSDATP